MNCWLKWILLAFTTLLGMLVLTSGMANSPIDPESCTYEGKKLYGNVEIVESFPELKVKQVDSFPDLRVQIVDSFPDECGKWKIVDSFPDLKVEYVDSFPDIKIKLVDSFPGIP